MSVYRPTKRQRRETPICPFDAHSLNIIASPFGILKTPAVSSTEKEIILNRLKKEIITPFELILSVPRLYNSNAVAASTLNQIKLSKKEPKLEKLKTKALKSRMYIGVNQGTRALELKEAQLVILCNDTQECTIFQHVIRHIRHPKAPSQVPIVLLPGSRASFELGETIEIKRASLIVFTKRPKSQPQEDSPLMSDVDDRKISTYHDKIDSFLEFCKSKIPSTPQVSC